jgi:hypothetical protein
MTLLLDRRIELAATTWWRVDRHYGIRLDYPPRRGWLAEAVEVQCDHGKPEGMTLCPACTEAFRSALRDIPRLMTELELHHTKQNIFVETGVPQTPDEDDEEPVDESPIPWDESASRCLADLRRALDDDPAATARQLLTAWPTTTRLPHLPELTGRVTRLVAKAHRIIDSNPYVSHYGTCPLCSGEIRIERVAVGDEVTHDCGYSAPLPEHWAAQMDLMADRMMTETQIIHTLVDAGEKLTRTDFTNLVHRQGLPRELRPVWDGGKLVQVFHYRLGDVRDLRPRTRRKGLDSKRPT